MKIINKPIKVMSIFNYEDKSFGNNNIMFVCQHNGSDIYEMKYEINNNKCYLYKK